MAETLNVAVVVGSLRAGSYSRKIAEARISARPPRPSRAH
jgi:hypothetical protein